VRPIEQVTDSRPSPSNDSVNPETIGASERNLRRASLAVRWLAVATVALALALFYVISASAGELVGRVVKIADGDTLTILDAGKHQQRIRLADIDAPERHQAFGSRSRQFLADLCFRKTATMEDLGLDRYGCTIGRIKCDGVNANKVQVERGMAWVYRRYAHPHSVLYGIESEARIRRVGLWADPHPVPPWEWRRMR